MPWPQPLSTLAPRVAWHYGINTLKATVREEVAVAIRGGGTGARNCENAGRGLWAVDCVLECGLGMCHGGQVAPPDAGAISGGAPGIPTVACFRAWSF